MATPRVDTRLACREIEAELTQTATDILASMVPETLDRAAPGVRARFDNALLNLAVDRILAVEGSERTATILWRLADVVGSKERPTVGQPIDLTNLDG